MGREQRQAHRQREESIKVYRQQVLKNREEALITKKRKEKQKKVEVCEKISSDGFWNSEARVIAGIAEKSEPNKKKCLEVQLRFRQHVLKQPYTDKSVFCVSKRGKKLSSRELSANLLKLISASPQATLTLGDILKSPELLVGMEIKHRFEADNEGTLAWYNGVVIGINGMEHEVIYYEELTIYQFDLLEDLSKGDLKVLFVS